MAEWVARAYRVGPRFRVVVEGVTSFETETLREVEERTAQVILARVRMFLPTRGVPWEDPAAEMVMQFEVDVRPIRGDPPTSDTPPSKEQLSPSRPSRR